jgi:RNA polymerase sigma factor (sigma-70 family)
MTVTRNAQTDFLPTRLSLLSRLRNLEDQTSWQRFFDTYWPLIFNVARRAGLSEVEAQDVVQDTVIAVARQIPDFRYDRARGSFKSWLLTITRRRIADHWRKKYYRVAGREVHREETLDTKQTEMEPLAGAEMERIWTEEWEQHILDTALARIKRAANPLQFQMFHLHVIKGQNVDQVTERLGVKAAEVYWAKYRLGARLKKEMRAVENR